MRLSLFVASAAILSASLMARADTVTDTILVSASSPVADLSLKYSLTFDPTLNYSSETSGITLDAGSSYATNGSSFLAAYGNAIFSAPFGFAYNPAIGYLAIGGLVNGVNSVEVNTSDFEISLSNAQSASPSVESIILVQPGSSSPLEYTSGSVTITQASSVTPEPSSLVLLGTGLLGAVGVVKRRFA